MARASPRVVGCHITLRFSPRCPCVVSVLDAAKSINRQPNNAAPQALPIHIPSRSHRPRRGHPASVRRMDVGAASSSLSSPQLSTVRLWLWRSSSTCRLFTRRRASLWKERESRADRGGRSNHSPIGRGERRLYSPQRVDVGARERPTLERLALGGRVRTDGDVASSFFNVEARRRRNAGFRRNSARWLCRAARCPDEAMD